LRRLIFIFLIAFACSVSGAQQTKPNPTARVRTYFIAADEIDWQYAASLKDGYV
jgi:hypothetical protein